MTNENVINILDLLNVLKVKWLQILVSGILVAMITFCYFSFFVPKQYCASAQLFIDIRKVSSEGKETYIASTHITAAKELATTYAHIIKTNIVLDEVIGDLNLDISHIELASKISISIVEDTPVLKLKVIDTDSNRALKIVSRIVDIAPEIINSKIDSGRLIAIDKPETSTVAVSPNILRNTVIGFFVGFLGYYAAMIFIRLFNNKIKSPEDIQNMLDMPILGVIPSLEQIQNK